MKRQVLAATVAILQAMMGAISVDQAIAVDANDVDQRSVGPCSPPIANNSGSITIECSGVSKEISARILEILNKILANQGDQKEIISKLDELIY